MKITIELNTEVMSESDQKIIEILAGTIEESRRRPIVQPDDKTIPRQPMLIPLVPIRPKNPFQDPKNPRIVSTKATPNLDKTGALWDTEIHISPPTLNAKGEWRLRKTANNLKVLMKQEENQRLFPKPPPAPLVPGPMPVVPPPSMVESAAAKPVAPPSPPVAAEEEYEPSEFSKLIAQLIPLLKSEDNKEGVVTVEQLESCAASLGLVDESGKGDISLLQYNEELIPTFGEKVNEFISS